MATTKTAPHLAALTKADDLGEQERAAREHRDKAQAHLSDLQARNQSGDHTVTGLDLVAARADVEAAEGLAAHAARVLADARAEAASLLAEHTAREIRGSLTLHDMDRTVQDAVNAVSEALVALHNALRERDAASDATGQLLADAGVPAGKWINGIRYMHVRRLMGTGTVVRGQFNVEVQTGSGGTAWVSSTGSARDATSALTEQVDEVLEQARASVPVGRKSGGSIF